MGPIFFDKSSPVLREQAVVTLALTPLTPAAVRAGVGGGVAGQPGRDSLGHAGGHAAGAGWACWPWRRCGTWPPGRCGRWRRCWAGWPVWPWATCRWPPRRMWAGVAGALAGGVLAGGCGCRWGNACWLGVPLAAAGAAVAGAATGQRRVRAAGGRHRAGQRGASCAPPATRWCTTPGRAIPPRATPATACWCRCCAPLDERVDTLVLSHRDSDHTGGAAAVLAMQPQAALLSSIEDRARTAGRCAR
jgi:competence protein ComEC